MRHRKGVGLDGSAGREGLGGVEGEGIITKLYYARKKNLFQYMRKINS